MGGYSAILRKECGQRRAKLGIFCKKPCCKSKVKVSIFSLEAIAISSDLEHFQCPVGGYSAILRRECGQMRAKLGIFCKKPCCKSKVKVSIFSLEAIAISSDLEHFQCPVGGYSAILRRECGQMRAKLGIFCKKPCCKSKVKVSIFSLEAIAISSDLEHFQCPVGGYSAILRRECGQMRAKLGIFCKKPCCKSKVKVSIFSLEAIAISSDLEHFQCPVGGYSAILRRECGQMRAKLGIFCKKPCCKSKVKVSIFSLEAIAISSDLEHFQCPVGGYSAILRRECGQMRAKLGIFCKKPCCKSKVKVSIFSLEAIAISSDLEHFQCPVGGYSAILRRECGQMRAKLGIFCKKPCCKSKVKVSIFSLEAIAISSDLEHFQCPVGGYSAILRRECGQMRAKLGIFCKKPCCKSKVKVSIFSLEAIAISSDLEHFQCPVGGYSAILRRECGQMRAKLGIFCKKPCCKSKVKVSIFSLEAIAISSDLEHFQCPVGGYSAILRRECGQMRAKLGIFCKKPCCKSKVKVSIFSLEAIAISSDLEHFQCPVGGYSAILRRECGQMRAKLGIFCKKPCCKSKVKVSIFSLEAIAISSDLEHFQCPVGGYSAILRRECGQMRAKLGIFCKKPCCKSKVKVSIFSLEAIAISSDLEHFQCPVGGYSAILRRECGQMRAKLGIFCKKPCCKSKVKVSIFSLEAIAISSDLEHFQCPVGGYSAILRRECGQMRAKLGIFCKKPCCKSKVKVSIFSLEAIAISSDLEHFQCPVGGYSAILRRECGQMRAKLGIFCKKPCCKSKVKVSIFSLEAIAISSDLEHFQCPVGGYSAILRRECGQMRAKLGIFCKKPCCKSKVKVSIFSLEAIAISSDLEHFQCPVGGYSAILRRECGQMRAKLGIFCKKPCCKSKVKVSIFSLEAIAISSDLEHFQCPVGGYSAILRRECGQMRAKLGIFCKKPCCKSKVKVSIFSLEAIAISSDLEHFQCPVGGYSAILRRECGQMRAKLGIFCKKPCCKSKVKVSIFSLEAIAISSDLEHFQCPVGGYSAILRRECGQMRAKLGIFCKKPCCKSKVKVSIFSLEAIAISSDLEHFQCPVGGYSAILRRECGQMRAKLGIFCKKPCCKSKVKVSIFSLEAIAISSDLEHFQCPVGGYSAILRRECGQMRAKLGIFCKKPCCKSKVKVSIFSLEAIAISSDLEHFQCPVGGYSAILRRECGQMRAKLGIFCKKPCCKSKVKVSIFSLEAIAISSDLEHFQCPVGGYSAILRRECGQMRAKLGIFCKKPCCKSKVKVSIFSLEAIAISSDLEHFQCPVGGYSAILRRECGQMRAKLGIFCKKPCCKSKVKVSIFSLEAIAISSDLEHFQCPVGGYSAILRRECGQMRAKLGIFCKKPCCKSKVKVSIFSLEAIAISSDLEHFQCPVGGYSAILRRECGQMRAKLGIFCKKPCCKSKVKVSIFSLEAIAISSDLEHFQCPVGGYSAILRRECGQMRAKLGIFCKKPCCKSKVKVSIFSLEAIAISSDLEHFQCPVGGYSAILRRECGQMRAKLGIFCKKPCCKSKVKVSIFSLEAIAISSDLEHFQCPVGGYSAILRRECGQMRAKLGIFCKKPCCKSKVKVSIFSLEAIAISSDLEHFQCPVGGYSAILRRECGQMRAKLGIFCKKPCCKSKVKVSIFSLEAIAISSDLEHFQCPVGGYSAILRRECGQMRAKLGIFCKKPCCKSKVKVSIFSLEAIAISSDLEHFQCPVGGYSAILRRECGQMRAKLGIFCKKPCCKSKVKVSIFSLEAIAISSDLEHFQCPVGGYSAILRRECGQMRAKLGIFCKKPCCKSKVKVSIFSLEAIAISSDLEHFQCPVGGYSAILRRECGQMRAKLGIFCKKPCCKSKVKVSIFSLEAIAISSDLEHFQCPVGGYSAILRRECGQMRAKLGIFCKKPCCKSKVKVSIFSLEAIAISSDLEHFQCPVGGYSAILRRECGQMRAKLGIFCKKPCCKSKVKVSIFSLEAIAISSDLEHFQCPVGGYSAILRRECGQMRAKLGIFCKKPCCKSKVKVSIFSLEAIAISSDLEHFQCPVGGYSAILRRECGQMRAKLGIFCKKPCCKSKVKVSIFSLEAIAISSDLEHFQCPVGGYSAILRRECGQMRAKLGIFCKKPCCKSKVKVSIFSLEAIAISSDLEHFQCPVGGYSAILRRECGQMRAKLGIFCKKPCCKSKVKVSIFSLEAIAISSDLEHFQCPVGGYSAILRRECGQMRAKLGIFCKKPCCKSKVKVSIFSLEAIAISSDLEHFQCPVGGYSAILRRECGQMRAKLGIFCKKPCCKSKVKVSIFSLEAIAISSDLEHFQCPVGGYSAILRRECGQMRAKLGIFCKKPCCKSKVKVSIFSLEAIAISSDLEHFQCPVGGYSAILRRECGQMRAKLGIFCKKPCCKSKVKVSIFSLEAIAISSDLEHFQCPVGGYSAILRRECGQMRAKLGIFCKKPCCKSKVKVSIFSLEAIAISSDLEHFQCPVGGYSAILRRECGQMRAKLGIFCKKPCCKSKVKVSIFSLEAIAISSDLEHFQCPVGGYSAILRRECGQMRAKLGIFCKKPCCKSKVKVSIFSLEAIAISSDLEHFQCPVGGYSAILRRECGQMRAKLGIFCKKPCCKSKVKVSIFSLEAIAISSDLEHFQCPVGGYSAILRRECGQMRAKLGIFCKKPCCKSKVKVSIFSLEAIAISSDLEHFQCPVGGYSAILRRECGQMRAKLGIFCKKPCCKSKVKVSIFSLEAIAISSDLEHFQCPVGGYSAILRRECGQMRAKLGIFCKKPCCKSKVKVSIFSLEAIAISSDLELFQCFALCWGGTVPF